MILQLTISLLGGLLCLISVFVMRARENGNDDVSYMEVFCAISQDAKCAFVRHIMFLIISVYVCIL